MRERYPEYHNRPVDSFGDRNARLVIVGLAPGAHGANATGRPFTGDYAGVLLYKSLHALGLATRPDAIDSNDGMVLQQCWITNAVKCLPPENKPTTAEVDQCGEFLRFELHNAARLAVVLALGTVAHRAVLKTYGLKLSKHPFAHGAVYELPGNRHLIDSYHCSRYNTQTGRLTEAMFMSVLRQAMEMSHA
jgi:uracil-DNA glycosylase family 4